MQGGKSFRPAPGILPYDLTRRPLTIRQSLAALKLAVRRRISRMLGRSKRR
jgi:hypothetical protein